MARKKRQYLQPEQAQEPVSAMLPSVWETAIYARLSVENSKKNDDGDSIEGQIEICRDYVSEHPYLHLADTYVDATVIIGLKQNPTYGRRFSPIFLLY